MKEALHLVTDIIRIDIFVGFGFYSILYFIIKAFLKEKKNLKEFDKSAVQTVIYGGIIWFILWLTRNILFYFEPEGELIRWNSSEDLTPEYTYHSFIQPLIWFTLTQLFRIKLISRYLINRVVISLLFVVPIEIFVILLTSFHRDYFPNDWSNWSINRTIGMQWILLGFIPRILTFIFATFIYHFGIRKLKKLIAYK